MKVFKIVVGGRRNAAEKEERMTYKLYLMKCRIQGLASRWAARAFESKSAGIDGILVTVGLCIIALLLCVVMKNSLTTFIETLVKNLQSEAQKMLGVVSK